VSNMLEDAVDFVHDQRHAALSETVTLSRGDDSVEISASLGESHLALADEDGIDYHLRVRDFLVRAADYAPAGTAVLPERGDRIARTDREDVTRTFEVLSPGGDEPHYRFSGPHRHTLRVHTKEVASL